MKGQCFDLSLSADIEMEVTYDIRAMTVNPKPTALNVELAQVEDEIDKLPNTWAGADAVLPSYAICNGQSRISGWIDQGGSDS